jgi:hypothetical protein
MSGEFAVKKIGRGCERNPDGLFQPMIGSFDLHLRAEKKSPETIRTYLEGAQWFAAANLVPAGLSGWSDVKARHVQEWTVTVLGWYSDAYASNQFHVLQQFFKWHAIEDPASRAPTRSLASCRRRCATSSLPSSPRTSWPRSWLPARAADSRTAATTQSSRYSMTPGYGCLSWLVGGRRREPGEARGAVLPLSHLRRDESRLRRRGKPEFGAPSAARGSSPPHRGT